MSTNTQKETHERASWYVVLFRIIMLLLVAAVVLVFILGTPLMIFWEIEEAYPEFPKIATQITSFMEAHPVVTIILLVSAYIATLLWTCYEIVVAFKHSFN